MKLSINPEIFAKWQGVKIGVLMVKGMDNSGRSSKILSLLRSEEKRAKEEYSEIEIGSLPEISVWRDIYRDFGSKPKKYKSSVESLVRRARGGEKPLPQINNLVDLYNYISLKYCLPAGAEDLDKIQGDIELGFAKGDEKGIYIGGEKEESCYEGEVIYKDMRGFVCRRWNWREAERTKIDKDTKTAVFVIEKASIIDEEVFQKALDEAKNLLEKYLSASVDTYILSNINTYFEIDYHSSKGKTEEKKKKPSKKKIFKPKQENPIKKLIEEDREAIEFRLKAVIKQALMDVFKEQEKIVRTIDISLERPKFSDYGDFSTNLALINAKKLKLSPQELAKKIVERIDEYIKKDKKISVKSDSKSHKDINIYPKNILEKIYVAGKGFINMHLSVNFLISQLARVLISKNAVKSTKNGIVLSKILKDKKIMVEYTDPNPFKQFHIGHLYSNVIGESLSRILLSAGADVWRADFYGDVGMHVAKSIWGMRELMKSEFPQQDFEAVLANFEKKTLQKRVEFLGRGYALGVKEYEKDKKIQNKIKDLNYFVYVASQEILKDEKGWKPVVDYRRYIEGRQNKLTEVKMIYKKGLKWSLEYFEDIYKRLGTKFDGYYPESWTGELGMKIAEEGLKMGVLEKSEGAVVYKGEGEGLHTRVFINKLGLPTYETKDLGLAQAKYRDFPYDLSINVFGKEIDDYYKVVKSALTKIRPDLGKKSSHLPHGMVNLPEGKMSSRSGNVITVNWLLKEIKKHAEKVMTDSNLEKVEKEDVLEKVAKASVKYAFLKSNIGADITFDLKSSVALEGESGPYLLYTYARCRSVINKSGKSSDFRVQISDDFELNTEEMALLRILYRLPEVINEAVQVYGPNLICNFLFDLAQKYNNFYAKHKILKSSKVRVQKSEMRLALTEATAIVLKKGLYLLGIETVERM